ncbi:membrane protein [Staphylococcus piscifermentans]|uniref:Membrane protein n=1 Tax=Staphylococcus piscifermentans TaxID=70258 RepID=A0A239TFQ1_9STAP|nr:DUF4064 domain-containing protein [Staphylococcus piscifermentans]RTX85397.1 DUF4064 domain-containing protein [Staphylococcus piscifermentans]GEP83603.1 membrane protein [Staphylococcus piscifermentans]SNU96531.1 membrane protein [Staphylococcus piscifermentans]
MIKRTAEHILTWIGVGLSAIGLLLIGLVLPFMSADSFIQGMQEGDGNITYEDATMTASLFQNVGIFVLILGLITLVIAIIGGVFINKNAKTAGILILIAGVISLLGNWVVAILWIIAGILLLVKKPQRDTLTEDGYYNYDKANEVAKDRNNEDPYKY